MSLPKTKQIVLTDDEGHRALSVIVSEASGGDPYIMEVTEKYNGQTSSDTVRLTELEFLRLMEEYVKLKQAA
jgi:hypothetical protein